jgi:anaerobic ribonucleoside-triphosphate reductase activating protein
VVFSGGEPTLQKDLAEAMREVKALGFAVGLHTAGTYPARLESLLPLVDWVGFDIKAPFETYDRVTCVPGSAAAAWESARLLLESGVPCEFRTTCHPHMHTREDLLRLSDDLAEMGVTDYVLQEFRPEGCIDAALCRMPASSLLDEETRAAIGSRFERFSVRGA